MYGKALTISTTKRFVTGRFWPCKWKISSFAKEKSITENFVEIKLRPLSVSIIVQRRKVDFFLIGGLLCLYDKQNNTSLLTDMKLLLLCSARYQLDTVYILFLDTLFVRCSRSWFDEQIEHSQLQRNSLSERTYVLFSIYWIRTKWPTLSYSLEAKSLKSSHIHRISMRDVARTLSDRFSYGPTIIDCWPQKRLLMNVKPSNLFINAPPKIAKS